MNSTNNRDTLDTLVGDILNAVMDVIDGNNLRTLRSVIDELIDSWSDKAYIVAYDDGYKDGHTEGHSIGYDKGFEAARKDPNAP